MCNRARSSRYPAIRSTSISRPQGWSPRPDPQWGGQVSACPGRRSFVQTPVVRGTPCGVQERDPPQTPPPEPLCYGTSLAWLRNEMRGRGLLRGAGGQPADNWKSLFFFLLECVFPVREETLKPGWSALSPGAEEAGVTTSSRSPAQARVGRRGLQRKPRAPGAGLPRVGAPLRSPVPFVLLVPPFAPPALPGRVRSVTTSDGLFRDRRG